VHIAYRSGRDNLTHSRIDAESAVEHIDGPGGIKGISVLNEYDATGFAIVFLSDGANLKHRAYANTTQP
jgi:hypothetical protein